MICSQCVNEHLPLENILSHFEHPTFSFLWIPRVPHAEMVLCCLDSREILITFPEDKSSIWGSDILSGVSKTILPRG